MALKLKGVKQIFPHSEEFDEGFKSKDRKGIKNSTSVSIATDTTTTETDPTDMAGTSVVHESYTGKVLVLFSGRITADNAEGVTLEIYKDGVQVTVSLRAVYISGTNVDKEVTTMAIDTSAEKNTWNIKWKVDGGGPTAKARQRSLLVMDL